MVEKEPEIYITNHAKERIKQRMNSKTKNRNPEELGKLAFREGISVDKINGSFYRWLDKRCYKYPNTLIKLYKDFIYIFNKSTPPLLITIFKVPNRYLTASKRLSRKSRRNSL